MKNPTGREWRWKLDDPEMIVAQAVAKHVKMIRIMRGVPGVLMDRWRAAHTVKHCALSLVGEPIMYPHIGRFVELLHERGISSFLVTNAQFPEAIANLPPVTQLYVSVDASTKDSLKAVDRPLFKDFWERFLESLSSLRAKRQRTVYRLTLVKRYNADDVDGYAELVARGSPDFIEIKAVTYSGDSNASDLTIKDCPFHEEVRDFCEAMVKKLRALGEDYGLACEHEHSNLVLLAKRKFYREEEDTWYTWIDYDKFHELASRSKASNGEFSFGAEDYMAPTPKWAHYNAPEAGFSPNEIRFRRTKGGGYHPADPTAAAAAGVGSLLLESKVSESKAAV
jgi:tRNA wybutosine-synthesizing protein 1